MNKDHDYIKELFDSDGIKAPESLSEKNMLAMLEATEEAQKETPPEKVFTERKARRSTLVKRFIATAAVALVAVLGISDIYGIITAAPDTAVVDGELYTFKSEREITNLLKGLDPEPLYRMYSNEDAGTELLEYETPMTNEIALPDAGAPTSGGPGMDNGLSSNSASGKTTGSSHSETYLQVDDVDEADIVKTDGKYIYYVTDTREVVILAADNGKTERLSTVGSSGIENYIDDIYIKGDTLITIGSFYRDDSDEEYTGIVVYDISDRSKPELLYDFSQTGSILTSRMVGDYVYLVTNDYVYRGGRAVPMCGSADNMAKLSPSDICCIPEPERTSYIVLSAVSIVSGKQGNTATKAILGASEDIYCNDHDLYSASEEWDEKSGAVNTRLVRASLDGTKVKFNATAKVRGYIDNQFSMDERNGYFRVATTSTRAGMDVNNLYVLDKELKEAGKVTGFARNESIKAVRYVGDKAYVITYEAIDPLFIIDLSDPADPRIEGEVKIDGFSTLLVPVSKDRLLGIGHATGDNGYGGEYDSGLKLALFDISDPSQPKVLDNKEFENMSSTAQYDHHALMVNNEAGYYAIPYEIWNYTVDSGDDTLIEDAEESYQTGVLLFKADDKFSSVDRHKLDGEQISRSVYIGDWIYALDRSGNVKSFKPSF